MTTTIPLGELEATFLRLSDGGHYEDQPFSEAQGVRFLCPLCYILHGRRPEGVHSIITWFDGVPGHVLPGPGRWAKFGSGLNDLTLKPSINLSPAYRNPSMPPDQVIVDVGCQWHGFIKSGMAEGGLP